MNWILFLKVMFIPCLSSFGRFYLVRNIWVCFCFFFSKWEKILFFFVIWRSEWCLCFTLWRTIERTRNRWKSFDKSNVRNCFEWFNIESTFYSIVMEKIDVDQWKINSNDRTMLGFNARRKNKCITRCTST